MEEYKEMDIQEKEKSEENKALKRKYVKHANDTKKKKSNAFLSKFQQAWFQTILVVFIIFFFAISITSIVLIFKKINSNLKDELDNMKVEYTERISKLEKEKEAVIETAFSVKDELLSRHYVQESKQFEDFMLNGTKIITIEYELSKTSKKNRLTQKQLRNYLAITFEGSRIVGLDPYLALAIDKVESGFNKYAKSPVGALGICQFMPGTARLIANSHTNFSQLQVSAYAREKLFDPSYSKKIQLRFLKYLLEEFEGRIQWALFAYNYGPDYVYRFAWKEGEVIFKDLTEEQQKYATDILNFYNKITMTSEENHDVSE